MNACILCLVLFKHLMPQRGLIRAETVRAVVWAAVTALSCTVGTLSKARGVAKYSIRKKNSNFRLFDYHPSQACSSAGKGCIDGLNPLVPKQIFFLFFDNFWQEGALGG